MLNETGGHASRRRVEFAGFRLDIQRRQLTTLDGNPVTLNSRAFDTLLALIARRGETLSKQELLEEVWPNAVVEENNLNQAISSLRKALGDNREDARGRHQIILTIPGRGYCFVADIKSVDEAPPVAQTVASVISPELPPVEASTPPPVLPPQYRYLTPAFMAFGFLAVLLLAIGGAALMDRGETPAIAETTAISNQPATAPALTGIAEALPHSVAVLPFTTRGFDPTKEFFTRGLHDELVHQLNRVSDLNVVMRVSVQRFRDSQLPAAEIARQLKVSSLLGGNVRFSGNRFQLDLQMSDPYTGLNLWSASYDIDLGNMPEIAAMQLDIATHVASALDAVLLPQEAEQLARVPTLSAAAFQSYLKAVAAQVQGDYPSARFQLQQTIDTDPTYIRAMVRLSQMNNLLATTPVTSRIEHFAEAAAAARQALALDPDSPDAHSALATTLQNSGDWKAAAAEYQLARRFGSPVDSSGSYAMFQLSVGDFAGARSTLKRQLQNDPVNLTARGFLMMAEELLGNREQSLREYEKGEAKSFEWWGDNTGLWLALGRDDREFLEKSVREFNRFVLREMLDKYAQPDQALEQLRVIYNDMAGWDSGQLVNASMFAAYYGEDKMAMDMLRVGLQDNWVNTYILWLPVFDKVRQSPEFSEFVEQAGFADYWRQQGWPQVCKPVSDTDVSCDWQAIPRAQ
ncbi:MAG: winged helix-turn-helix domain-containing protein [Pseudomonadota bacterium]